ncbi:hypothetical protein OF83DRAFT_138866 [Amylostereum chailletii]|nr:hypothetical protein OF83DRAFT_138866 [Amylostereum chailletii]
MGKFRGDSARLLHDILASYLDSPTGTNFHARYVSHIQSSGTGKSRGHDELAKDILYIPLNLAASRTSRFPPADHEMAAWIKNLPKGYFNTVYAEQRFQGFFYGLFTVTVRRLSAIQADPELDIPSRHIEDIERDVVEAENPPIGLTIEDEPDVRATLFRLARLARAFRGKLAEGCVFDKHREYRRSFYEEVQTEAKKFIESSELARKGAMMSSVDTYDPNGDVMRAAETLHKFLDPLGVCNERGSNKHLLAVISIDEAHELTNRVGGSGKGDTRTLLSQLRYPLPIIKKLPFFTVFLSTSGEVHLFSPDPAYNPSDRIRRNKFNQFDPITETGFDEFADKVDVHSGKWTLSRVASTHHIAHLGRSLFAALYDAGSEETKKGMVGWARTKLLGADPLADQLDGAMKLACLAVRLGLDFKGTRWVEREVERTQVERHVRICLSATAGFHSFTTASASEPLLAEAASNSMAKPSWGAADALLSHMDSSYLDPGDRGEVIAALLLLLARDRASDATHLDLGPDVDLDEEGFTMKRIVKIPDFLAALLQKNVDQELPATYVNDEDRDISLRDRFKDGNIWFNHFVKLNNFSMLSKEYLARLIARGAAVICANNQRGVDIVIPFLFGNVLRPDKVSAILIQVKNDKSYTTNVKECLFEAMDPLQLRIVAKDEHAKEAKVKPVIRMVFALASSSSGISRPSVVSNRKYTAYDIWCAGTSDQTFVPIQARDGVFSVDSGLKMAHPTA